MRERLLLRGVETAFEWVLGKWTFERTVAPHASVRGAATITLIAPGEALYSESAQVTLATGEVLSGKQNYCYRRQENGFDIFFSESGLLFQSLQFRREDRGLVATATHRCVNDDYASEYVLSSQPDQMLVRHVVRGPMKDYVSTTVLQRSFPTSAS